MRGGLVALALLVAAAPAAAIPRNVDFQMPSKKIVCSYHSGAADENEGPRIRCDLFFLNDRAVLLEDSGRAKLIKVTDTVAAGESQTLRYGTSKKFGKFTCTSRTSGLTCTKGSHGFEVSRQEQRVF